MGLPFRLLHEKRNQNKVQQSCLSWLREKQQFPGAKAAHFGQCLLETGLCMEQEPVELRGSLQMAGCVLPYAHMGQKVHQAGESYWKVVDERVIFLELTHTCNCFPMRQRAEGTGSSSVEGYYIVSRQANWVRLAVIPDSLQQPKRSKLTSNLIVSDQRSNRNFQICIKVSKIIPILQMMFIRKLDAAENQWISSHSNRNCPKWSREQKHRSHHHHHQH